MNLHEIARRFESGNSVPVERAYLTKHEFDLIFAVIDAAKHQAKTNPGKTTFGLIDALADLEAS